MVANVSFVGLNSNFDSGSLISQLVDLETQSRVAPLENKKIRLEQERTFLGNVSGAVGEVRTGIDYDNLKKGDVSLAPKLVTSTDTDNEFVEVTTDDTAVAQTFRFEATQLATNTIHKSDATISQNLTTASSLTLASFKNASSINTGSVTINGETLTYNSPDKTIMQSATTITQPTAITSTTVLDNANFKAGAALTSGSVILNGQTQAYTPSTGTDTVQDMLDFLSSFTNITATLESGKVQLEGITSQGVGVSNLLIALGIDTSTLTGDTIVGDHDLTEQALEDYGITGTNITINGEAFTFDPSAESIDDLIATINASGTLAVTASYNSDDDKFVLTNDDTGAAAITVSSSDGNIITQFDITDHTPGGDDQISTLLTFMETFSSVTSANLTNGQIVLAGTVTNVGSPGDSSNLVSALGFDNAVISGGGVTGIQNISAVGASTVLTDIGITGSFIKINGEEIAYDPATDTISGIVQAINNNATAKVSAAFDSINGEIVLSNDDTGALSITISSDGDISALNLNNASSETLGDNAEFTISTLNGGGTLVSNSNTIEGLITGVALDLKKATTGPVTVTIAEDPTGYKERINDILKDVNSLLSGLKQQNDSFSKSFISRVKTTLTNITGVNGVDTYTSFIELGIESQLDGEGNFIGYQLDDELFDAAFENAPDELNTTLWGDSSDPDSIYTGLSNGDTGILVQLIALLDSYVDPNVSTNGIITQVQDSITSQISSVDDSIERAEGSIEAMEIRLRRQFAQLDVVNAEFQQQQAAVSSLSA